MTGAGGHKKFGGPNFFPLIREWRPKKGLMPKYTPWLLAGLLLSRVQISLVGHVFHLGVGRGTRQDPMMRILLLAYRFRGKDQNKRKNRSSSWNLRLRHDVHLCFFCSRRGVYSRLGGHFEGTGPRNALQWHWACYLLLGHNPRLRGHIPQN